jgi:transcriptional regulator with XRE-family HTH domain
MQHHLNHAKIRSLRLALGLTQQQAADAAGLDTRMRWHDLEAGRASDPHISTVKRIARALQATPADIIIYPSTHRSPASSATSARTSSATCR